MRFLLFSLGVLIVLSAASPVQAGFWDSVRNAMSSDLGQSVLTGRSTSGLSTQDIELGLRQALEVSTGRVVTNLSQPGGFSNDSLIQIPLPPTLQRAQRLLRVVGASGLADDLQLKLNEAAEAATPQAKALFIDAITGMSLSDARSILTGPDDAATQYLRRSTEESLLEKMRPIIDRALSQVGAANQYDRVVNAYQGLPLAPSLGVTDLRSYVGEKALDGVFTYIAKEEAAIRTNPAKRSTDLLRKVFAN